MTSTESKEPKGSDGSSTDSPTLDDLCRCGHPWRRHLEPPGAQCTACPGDSERSWRHEFAPEKPEHRCNACGHTEGEGCGCSAHSFVSREHCDRCEGTWLIKNARPEDRDSLPPCRACKHTLFYFDRSPCASCGVEHYRCRACRVEQIACVRRAPAEECSHIGSRDIGGSDVPGARWTWFRCDNCGKEWVRDWETEKVTQDPPPASEEADELAKLIQELPPPEGPEYTPCLTCGHIEPEHSPALFRHCLKCVCLRYRPQAEEPKPPQPERRPPLAYAYSVQGHLYEVALPGDATVVAQDGALIITHSLGPVAGIVQARPLEGEQS